MTWHSGLPLATAVKQVSVTVPGVCYKNGVTTGDTNQSSCTANGGTWTAGGNASLEQQFTAQQQTNGRLYSQYTVKLDTNGWISGFGLANTQNGDGSVISDFGVRADRFWIAAPSSPQGANSTLGVALLPLTGPDENGNQISNGVVVRVHAFYGVGTDSSGNYYPSGTRYAAYICPAYTPNLGINAGDFFSLKNIRANDRSSVDTSWSQSFPAKTVGSVPYLEWDYNTGQAVTKYTSDLPGVNGNYVIAFLLPNWQGPGYTTANPYATDQPRLITSKYLPFVVTTTPQTYNGVSVPAGVYMNSAFIVDASITNAKIYGDIRSADYNGAEGGGSGTGTTGWCINKFGNAIFNNQIWRGDIQSDYYTTGGSTGWKISRSGDAVFNSVIVRSGAQIGSNALVQAATVVDYSYTQGSSSFTATTNGDTIRYAANYTPKTSGSKTAGFFFGLDLDVAANYTTKVVVEFSGAFSYVWTAYYKGGSILSSRQLSSTTTYNGVLTGQPLYTKVTATNNGPGGTWGDIKLSILEITG